MNADLDKLVAIIREAAENASPQPVVDRERGWCSFAGPKYAEYIKDVDADWRELPPGCGPHVTLTGDGLRKLAEFVDECQKDNTIAEKVSEANIEEEFAKLLVLPVYMPDIQDAMVREKVQAAIKAL